MARRSRVGAGRNGPRGRALLSKLANCPRPSGEAMRGHAISRVFLNALLMGTGIAVLPVSSALAERPRVFAITSARVIVAPGQVVEEGTVVLRDGLIEAVGKDVKVPPDAVTVDGKGKTVHAGFIDACSEAGLARPDGAAAAGGPPPPAGPAGGRTSVTQPPPGAVHPITRVRPEKRMLDQLEISEKDDEKRRNMGFTAALAVPGPGIFRG